MTKLLLTIGTSALMLLSSIPAHAQGVDPVNRGPMNIFSRDQVHCGKGTRIRGLIWGSRPVSACMLKVKRSGFGGPL